MEFLHTFLDIVLHLDKHLGELMAAYDVWVYAILFVVIFAETGLVVTPFLPGDSLLFALGALIASTGQLSAPSMWALLCLAAVLGNTLNYAIGRALGQHAFSGRYRLIKVDYLRRTEAYFVRHGAATMILSRFAPIIRTFAPFVAGIGHMPYLRFQTMNIIGGVAWVSIFLWGGYLIGNWPPIKNNFGFVTIAIVIVSVMPMVVMVLRDRAAARAAARPV
jgi:membrane-associated protein